MLEAGQPAPTFTLPNDTGEPVSLESFRGKPVVLYFYPKDDTPGCFEPSGAVVLGVSPDSPKRHARFRDKYGLPFTLLSDEDHSVSEAYGVWVEKSFAGKKYMGVERSTFVIGPDGTLQKVMRRVKPAEHAGDVLVTLAAS
jgi:thioredoxin-dependent peroxiredoxin